MNIADFLREKVLKFLRIDKLTYNPDDDRYTFVGDIDTIRKQKLDAYKVWYNGDSDELLSYYTEQQLYGNYKEPLYNRNKRNYFWGLSSTECKIKRVHSGVPNAIITTLSNVVGDPKIKTNEPEFQDKLDRIIEDNDFIDMLKQKIRPMTMVLGWSGLKPSFDKTISSTPIIQYYEANKVEFAVYKSKLVAIFYKDYYEYEGKRYLLVETRRIVNQDSHIEYELLRMKGKDEEEVEPVELDTIPELADLEDIVIPNFPYILGVSWIYLTDIDNPAYGLSYFNGKIDLFDDLDQDLSQNSQTTRVSTPVEYIPADLLKHDKNNHVSAPNYFNRQIVKREGIPNGDGVMDNGQIVTTQPVLNFDQYSQNAKTILDFILIGRLSPATMGVDISKKDNAEAQREKEKVTIDTRNHIINRETRAIKKIMSLCLVLQEYMDTGTITKTEYEIGVIYPKFANPSFETRLQTLGPALSQGQISTERYVDLLWEDSLTDEQKQKEIAWLDEQRAKDTLTFSDFENAPNEAPEQL